MARIVALLAEQAGTPPLVALAAPTGKAMQRLEEAVHEQAGVIDVSPAVREHLLSLNATTVHKLLGARPGTSRRRHHRGNRLPHEVVIVDETSMVSLSQMARLVEAVRPEARLVLVGDPDQLSSIEAGAVLSDIVNAGGGGVVVLDHVFRFGAGIGALASAIRGGDPDEVLEVLASAPEGVTWLEVDIADPAAEAALAPVREAAELAARAVIAAARAGDAPEALRGARQLPRAVRRIAAARTASRSGWRGSSTGWPPNWIAGAGTPAARCS